MGKGKDKEYNYQIPSQAMQTEFGEKLVNCQIK